MHSAMYVKYRALPVVEGLKQISIKCYNINMKKLKNMNYN